MANSKRYNQETKEKQKLVSEESPLGSAGRRESLSSTALEENMMQDAKIKNMQKKTEEITQNCQEMHFLAQRPGTEMSKTIYKN